MGMPAGGRLALAGALLVAAACADDGGGFGPSDTSAPDEAVPWSQAVEVAAARRGEYREAVVVSSDGDSAALSEQWIAYDLDAPFVDRAIAVHVDPKTRRYTSTATRENPSLRFIYTAGSVFMRHPRAQAACGTAWIEIPPEELAQAAGATFDASRLQDLEPLDLLRSAKDPGPPVRTDGRGSVYEVPAPGTTGLALSVLASRPGLADRIAAEQRTAEVRVPRGGGPVEITIDLTDVMADVAGTTDAPVGFRPDVELTWTVTAPVADLLTTIPTDVATREECSAAGG